MSSISRASSSTLRRIMARWGRISSDVWPFSWSPESTASTGVRGVRSSWLKVARKWSLARLAASASWRARSTSSSARRRAVTSVSVSTQPSTSSSEPKRGPALTWSS